MSAQRPSSAVAHGTSPSPPRHGDGGTAGVPRADVPAPAETHPAVWRVVGDPLVAAADGGALSGTRVAVKDLFAVAGHAIGAGNPAWLREAPVEPAHAAAVEALLRAGADVTGIARTDELAYGLSGLNTHYGMPPNPAAPGRVPGGSSSGSASAVALGLADIGDRGNGRLLEEADLADMRHQREIGDPASQAVNRAVRPLHGKFEAHLRMCPTIGLGPTLGDAEHRRTAPDTDRHLLRLDRTGEQQRQQGEQHPHANRRRCCSATRGDKGR